MPGHTHHQPRTLSQLSRRLLLAYLLLLFVLFLALQFGLLYPRNLTYVTRLQQLAIAGFRQDLEQLAITQLAINRDYAYWDDSYRFVQKPSQSYIEGNLNQEADTLGLLGLSGLLITDINLRPVYAQAKHPDTQEYIPFEGLFPANQPLIDPSLIVADGRIGWHYNEQGVFLLSVAMIRPTLQQGPPAGYMIFLRHLSAHQLIEAGKLQGLKIEPFNDSITAPQLRPLSELTGAQFVAADAHSFYLPGPDGRPALALTAEHQSHPLPPLLSLRDLLLLLAITLLPFLGMLRYQQRMIRPIARTIGQIGRMDPEGLPLPLAPQSGVKDLENLVDSYNLLVRSVREDQERLKNLADTDGLTGLLNRRAFDQSLRHCYQRALRLGTPLCLVLLDVDYFKRYNDHYGHPAGDAVLRQLGNLLRQHFNRATDYVGRYGGEEFVLLVEAQNAIEVQHQLEQLRRHLLRQRIEHCGSDSAPVVSISIGAIYWNPEQALPHPKSIDDLLALADANLYRAKQAGRNRLVFNYSPAAQQSA